MQITVILSRHRDPDLYAYFLNVKGKRGSVIKNIIRDYLQGKNQNPVEYLPITCTMLDGMDGPAAICIPVAIGKADADLVEFFGDCRHGLRATCLKSILRIMISPHVQSVYHYNVQPLRLPYMKTDTPGVDFWNGLIQALSGLQPNASGKAETSAVPVTEAALPAEVRETDGCVRPADMQASAESPVSDSIKTAESGEIPGGTVTAFLGADDENKEPDDSAGRNVIPDGDDSDEFLDLFGVDYG